MTVRKNVVHSVKEQSHHLTKKLMDLELVPPDHLQSIEKACKKLPFNITPHLLKILEHQNDHSPISRQFIPSPLECRVGEDELSDPIGDGSHSPVKGIVHRYPDRVLLTPTLTCPVYCRFCFRREAVGHGLLKKLELERALEYIKTNSDIWEVILSGGDPFTLSSRRLKELISNLENIEHVGVIRIHTRVPIVDPDKITGELISAIKSKKPVFIVVHCNHSDELIPETEEAIARLVDNGFPLLAQTVLLKGINDNANTLKTLMKRLVKCRVKPYYLHHGDKAEGTSHFRTTIATGQTLVKKLRGSVSGLCQPNYMLDIPNGHGKVPIGPSYLEASEDMYWNITDWKGVKHRYRDE